MPIDPSIILGIQAPQVPSPFATMAAMQQMQTAQQERQIHAAQLQQYQTVEQERQQKILEQQQLDAAWAAASKGGSINRQQLQDALSQNGLGHHIPLVIKQLDEADKAGQEAKQKRAEADLAEADYFGSLAAGVAPYLKDPDGGMSAAILALQHAASNGHDISPLVAALKDAPERLPQMITHLREASPKQRELMTAKQSSDTNAQDLALRTPELRAKGLQAQLAAASQRLATATTPEQYAATLNQIAPPLRAEFPATFDPQTTPALVRAKGLTPEQQATALQSDRTFTETQRHNKVDESVNQQRASTAAKQANEKQDNATDVASAIISGDQPPDLSRLYGMAGAVRATLARQGYNLTRAQEDWQATSKYIQTLNGSQQVRLRQAVDFTSESLKTVKQLVQQWNPSTFGPLSKAQLSVAMSGALGADAKSIATRLNGQISDIQSELGTVYKGGNSSTDESLKLAAANLDKAWDTKTMLDNLQQIETNLGYRRNSMRTAGVAGASATNPYAPSTDAPAAAPPTAPASAPATAAPTGGAQEAPIPGIPGGVARLVNGKWIRVK